MGHCTGEAVIGDWMNTGYPSRFIWKLCRIRKYKSCHSKVIKSHKNGIRRLDSSAYHSFISLDSGDPHQGTPSPTISRIDLLIETFRDRRSKFRLVAVNYESWTNIHRFSRVCVVRRYKSRVLRSQLRDTRVKPATESLLKLSPFIRGHWITYLVP